jgi:hypothetical protein
MHSPQCTLHSLLCSLPRGFSGPKPKPLRPTRPSARGQGGVSAASAPADPGLPGLDGERTPRARGATRRPAGDSDPMGDRELAPRPRPLEMPVNLGLHSGLCSGALSTVQRGHLFESKDVRACPAPRDRRGAHWSVQSPPGRQCDPTSESPQRTYSFHRRPRAGTPRAPQPDRRRIARDATGRDRRCAEFHHSPPPPHA